MPPTGSESRGRFNLLTAVVYVLLTAFREQPYLRYSVTRSERNEEIRTRYLNGYSIPNLAEIYGLSNARIHQILHGRRN
jgi:hypothetical protein